MSRKFLLTGIIPVLLFILALSFLTATPAFAHGSQATFGPFCAGDNITLPAGQTLNGMLAFGCNVKIEQGATVNGDIFDFGGNFDIAGAVNGDITTFGGNLNLAETAVIAGAVNSMGGNVQRAPGAAIQGGVNNNSGRVRPPIAPIAPFRTNIFERTFNFGFDILGGIVTALAFAALGALVVIFAPNATRRVSDAVQAKPLNSAGVGCLTLILLPVLCILLFITIIGIPIGLILGFLSAIAWIFGGIGVGLLAGEKILQAFKANNILPVLAVIIGVLILAIIGQVPIIGWLISLLVGLIGLGAVVLTRFGTRVYPIPAGMMLAPAGAAAATSVPGSYTPSAVDVAAWEEKANQAHARETAPESSQELTTPPADASAEIPPTDSPPPGDADETRPNT